MSYLSLFCTQIESLCLAQCSVSRGVVDILRSLPQLKSLTLDCVTCRDPGEAVSETDVSIILILCKYKLLKET